MAWPVAFGRWTDRLRPRRLSIIDLSDRGAQPMQSADGRLSLHLTARSTITDAFAQNLRLRGTSFAASRIPRCCSSSMPRRAREWCRTFAGCLHLAFGTLRNSELLLARDPYGVKPLYYSDDGRCFRFASQVKAIMAGGWLRGRSGRARRVLPVRQRAGAFHHPEKGDSASRRLHPSHRGGELRGTKALF